MVAIEDLMKLGMTRRQVEAIAQEMGFPPANEYPDEVKNEVTVRTQKKGKGRKGKAQPSAEQAAEEQVSASMEEDIKDVDEGAQRRAAAMSVGRDALTLYYLATGNFTVPELKDAVEGSRTRLKHALRGEVYEPEAFLSQMAGDGTNGTMRSLNGSSETSPSSAASTTAESCDSGVSVASAP